METVEYVSGKYRKFVIRRLLSVTLNNFIVDDNEKNIFRRAKKLRLTKIRMRMTSVGCPVQYEGTINGKQAYYRDRWGTWTLEIYEKEQFSSKVIFYREGKSDIGSSGYNDFLKAEQRIMKHATVFTRKYKKDNK